MGNVLLKPKYIVFSFTLISFLVSAESGTSWDLDHMQKQRVLYEAKAALNKAKAEAEGKESGVSALVNPSMSSAGQILAAPVADGLPQLVKINGRNAVLSTRDGNTISVTSGQIIPGGRWRVLNISLDGVKVKNIDTQRKEIIN